MIAPTWRQAMTLAAASLGTLACALGLPGAAAQELAPAEHAAPRHPHGAEKRSMIPKGSIRIVNHDSSTLLSLSLSSDGGDPDIVAQNIARGGSVVVALPKPGECVYDVEAKFEDWSWSKVPKFNLCKDQTLAIGDSSSAAATEPSTSAKSAAPSARAKTSAAGRPSGEKRETVASTGRIRVENHRDSTLLLLLLAIRGEARHVVAERVKSGESVVAVLPKAGQCIYDIEVQFADDYGTSIPGHDLCKDPTLSFGESQPAAAPSTVASGPPTPAAEPPKPAAAPPARAAGPATPAKAAAAPRPPEEAKRSVIPKGRIHIENRRRSTLLSLSLASNGSAPRIVAKNLPSKAAIIVALPKRGQCVYDVEGSFEDRYKVHVPKFDFCKDQTLNIVE